MQWPTGRAWGNPLVRPKSEWGGSQQLTSPRIELWPLLSSTKRVNKKAVTQYTLEKEIININLLIKEFLHR